MNKVRLAAALFLMIMTLTSCGKQNETEQLEPVVRPVAVMTVEAPSEGRVRSFSGMAKSAVETPLSFRVSGKIIQLNAKRGMKVKAGDLIAKLDPSDYRLQVQQLRAELARVEASLKQAHSEYKRVRKLYEVSNATKSDLDAAMAAYDSAKALKTAAVNNLELAQRQHSYTTLTAPLDGAIAEVPVEVYQAVQAGSPVAVLTSGKKIEMEIGAPEQIISLIKAGDRAEVQFDALPGEKFTAQVIEVGVIINQSNTYPVKLRINETTEKVKAGMVGQSSFFFKAPEEEKFYIIPPVAVVGAPGNKNYVWKIDEKNASVVKQMVTVGLLTSDGLQIVSGISPGDKIVIRGVHRLEEGQQVRLMEKAAG